MSRVMRGFLFRTIIAITLVGFAYTFFVLLPYIHKRERQQVPDAALITFRAAVDQDYVSLAALASQTGSVASASVSLAQARSDLQQSYDAFNKALRHPPKHIASSLTSQLKNDASAQNNIMDAYDGRASALSKPIEYVPASDLSLDETGIANANKAHDALKTFATESQVTIPSTTDDTSSVISPVNATFTISGPTKQALLSSANCFANFANQLSAKNQSGAKSTLATCIKNYETTRSKVVAETLLPLTDASGKQLTSSLLACVRSIDALIDH